MEPTNDPQVSPPSLEPPLNRIAIFELPDMEEGESFEDYLARLPGDWSVGGV